MSDYVPPLAAIRRALDQAGLAEIARLNDADGEAESLPTPSSRMAARFAVGELAPLNTVGDRADRSGAGEVVAPPRLNRGLLPVLRWGWPAVSGPGLRRPSSAPPDLHGARRDLAGRQHCLRPGTPAHPGRRRTARGARHGGPEDRLPTPTDFRGVDGHHEPDPEPQAGSDLSQVRSRAEPAGEDRYKLQGQKIFISYGDHDLTENIVHLVLARSGVFPTGGPWKASWLDGSAVWRPTRTAPSMMHRR